MGGMADQGAQYSPIRWEDRWFRGEDKKLRFKVTLADDVTIPDFTGWEFEWFLREEIKDPDAILTKADPSIEVVTGPDPDDPDTQIEMVQVNIDRADTDDIKPGRYVHALARTDTGEWAVLAEGEAVLRASAGG
jgi:hypothetical protein